TVMNERRASFSGASRSGKTTLLRVIARFEIPNSGRVLFDERDVTRVPVRSEGDRIRLSGIRALQP
ncbi:MAG: ATP-binding cassette domain-containing protein, partial [Myxococcota bacterium]|nr:ATP-binding cassette domain-containing protein [Myxococcota bacterium]